MPTSNKCCGTCFFGAPDPSSFAEPSRICKRYPPKQQEGVQRPDANPHPVVSAAEWCGEYKRAS